MQKQMITVWVRIDRLKMLRRMCLQKLRRFLWLVSGWTFIVRYKEFKKLQTEAIKNATRSVAFTDRELQRHGRATLIPIAHLEATKKVSLQVIEFYKSRRQCINYVMTGGFKLTSPIDLSKFEQWLKTQLAEAHNKKGGDF